MSQTLPVASREGNSEVKTVVSETPYFPLSDVTQKPHSQSTVAAGVSQNIDANSGQKRKIEAVLTDQGQKIAVEITGMEKTAVYGLPSNDTADNAVWSKSSTASRILSGMY